MLEDREGSVTFSPERLERLTEIEREHFWFAGRRRLVLQIFARQRPPVRARILDLGAGGGDLSRRLSDKGYRMTAADFLPGALKAMPNSIERLQCSAEQVPLRAGSYDVVLALDLLEHVDDEQTIREIARLLKKNGWCILSVPAFPWLWSYRDEAAGHYRRYRKADLVALVRGAGLRLERLSYYQFFLFPLLAAGRILARRQAALRDLEDRPWPVLRRSLSIVNCAEVMLGRWARWPWGSSLLVVARKCEDC